MTTEPQRDKRGTSGTPGRPSGGWGADASRNRSSGSLGSDYSRGMNQASRGLAVAFGFVGVVLVFFGAGRLLDGWLGTEPWLLVVGSIVGWVLGVVVVYYTSQRSLD